MNVAIWNHIEFRAVHNLRFEFCESNYGLNLDVARIQNQQSGKPKNLAKQ